MVTANCFDTPTQARKAVLPARDEIGLALYGGGAPVIALPGTPANFLVRARGLPVYVSGNFNLHPQRVKAALDWFSGVLPGAEFAYARELVARAGGIDAWSRRWPVERAGYGAMLLLTAALSEDDATHSGQHVLEEPIALEVDTFLHMRRPIGWLALPTGFGEVRFTGRFVVESLRRINFLRFAEVAPAVDAQPFAPAVILPVQAQPHLRMGGYRRFKRGRRALAATNHRRAWRRRSWHRLARPASAPLIVARG